MIDSKMIQQVHKFGAVFTDDELGENIKVCQYIIDNLNSDSPELLEIRAYNALKILNKEIEKRWWNRLKVSDKINEIDIKYIQNIVNLRYIQACRLLGKDKDILEANEVVKQIYLSEADSMFTGFDIGLTAFKEIKGL
jgi:hypothetical protein